LSSPHSPCASAPLCAAPADTSSLSPGPPAGHLARIVFRLVEFAAGTDPSTNPIPFTDAYFYALDALPMFLALLVMNVVHPGRVLVGPESEFPRLTKAQKKVQKEARRAEERALKEARKAGKGGWECGGSEHRGGV
jgi:hypothetical protein